MSRLSRKHLLIAGLVVLALAVIPALTLANHAWSTYHWARTSNPFTLKLGDNLSSTWDPYLATASSDWTASSVLNTTIVAGGTTGRQCKPTAGRIEVCNATYGNNGWLGLASIWLTNGHISQATAKMNDSYFNTAQYNTPAWHRLVMCQEVAHGFGLDHQDTNFNNANLGTCMDYTNNPSGPPSNEHPNTHDYDELATIYAHLDSFTTVGMPAPKSMPPAMNQISLDGPGQWGPVIGGSTKGGLVSVHELDFGHGNKVITYVIWAK